MTTNQSIALEQQFFDREADALSEGDLLIPSSSFERYRSARPSPANTAKDSLFADIMPVAGKKVLEYGCGTGHNACLLAEYGAQVNAFDLSPVAIAKARRRAEIHGLAERVQFDTRRAGDTEYPQASFDAVTGFAILHHLHMKLPSIFEEVSGLLAPGGKAYFIEPVANSPLLRHLRPLVPVQTDATPDERQLTYEDLEPLGRYFSSVEIHHHYCLERIHRLVGDRLRAPLRWIDNQALRALPFLRRYYGLVLVIARR
jgi:2-polyprenyl-3-methyl-5-hydroxy-6-metoxy-1,4-benzoquinol methylase